MRSVWHNFTEKNMGVMGGSSRGKHPTRQFVNEFITTQFLHARFKWCEIGTLGMVDYQSLRPILDFEFTGLDLSESIREHSSQFLRDGDTVRIQDIQLPNNILTRFDLLTMRAVLNHCENWKSALRHSVELLKPDGLLIITLHIPLTNRNTVIAPFTGYPTDDVGIVIRAHINRTEFFGQLAQHNLSLISYTRFVDKWKPNDVIICRKDNLRSGFDNTPTIIQMRPLYWRVGRCIAPTWFKRFVRVMRR